MGHFSRTCCVSTTCVFHGRTDGSFRTASLEEAPSLSRSKESSTSGTNSSTHSLQGGLISDWVPINSSALVVFTWICLTKLRLYRFSTRKSSTLACNCPPWPGPVHQTSQWRKCNRGGKQALEANCSQHTRTVPSHVCAAGGDPWSQ